MTTSRRESRNESVEYTFNEIKLIPHVLRYGSALEQYGSYDNNVLPLFSVLWGIKVNVLPQSFTFTLDTVTYGATAFAQRTSSRVDIAANGAVTVSPQYQNQFTTPALGGQNVTANSTGNNDGIVWFRSNNTVQNVRVFYKVTLMGNQRSWEFIDTPYAGNLI